MDDLLDRMAMCGNGDFKEQGEILSLLDAALEKKTDGMGRAVQELLHRERHAFLLRLCRVYDRYDGEVDTEVIADLMDRVLALMSQEGHTEAGRQLDRTYQIPRSGSVSVEGGKEGEDVHIRIKEPGLGGRDTGGRTWEAGEILIRWLASTIHPSIQAKVGKEREGVLELGCGTGIVGIGLALLGASNVLMTDYDEMTVQVALDNARLNGLTVGHGVQGRALDWMEDPVTWEPQDEDPAVGMIVGADVVYEPHHGPCLARVMHSIFAKERMRKSGPGMATGTRISVVGVMERPGMDQDIASFALSMDKLPGVTLIDLITLEGNDKLGEKDRPACKIFIHSHP